MRFDQPQQPPPYLNSRDQWRLLRLVGGLSFIVIAILWAARPDSWYWLLPPGNETATNTTASDAELFHAAPDRPTDSAITSSSAHPLALPQEWLEDVNDQQLLIRGPELTAMYRCLAHIQRLDVDMVDEQARRDVLHVNLMQTPDEFRGDLIHVKGTARLIQPIEVFDNEFGLTQAYEIWLTTPDSGSDPWRIVCSHLDPRLPRGDEINVQVVCDGYFFKRYSYNSLGGHHTAPMLIASSVHPHIVIRVAPSGTGLQPYLISFALFFGVGTLLLVSAYHRGDRRFRKKIEESFPTEDEKSVAVLEDLQGVEYDPTRLLQESASEVSQGPEQPFKNY